MFLTFSTCFFNFFFKLAHSNISWKLSLLSENKQKLLSAFLCEAAVSMFLSVSLVNVAPHG